MICKHIAILLAIIIVCAGCYKNSVNTFNGCLIEEKRLYNITDHQEVERICKSRWDLQFRDCTPGDPNIDYVAVKISSMCVRGTE